MRTDYNFQQGQEVARIFHHWERHIEGFSTIDRVTATHAIIGTSRYGRSDGRAIGKYASSANTIEPATDAVKAEYAAQERRAARREFLKRFLDGNWQSMGEDNLDKVATALGFEGESKEQSHAR